MKTTVRALAPLSIRLLLPCLLCLAAEAVTADDAVPLRDENVSPAALDALRAGEAIVLMRHALAPGTGDPPEFVRGDCATQRNLSAAGREQARRAGGRLAALLDGRAAEVRSSAWCRCLETARLLGLGAVEPLAALDSFFRERDAAAERTAALGRWIDGRLGGGGARPVAVLVTHQVNISALTGAYAASGDMLIVGTGAGAGDEDGDGADDGAAGPFVVLARIGTDVTD